MAETVFIDRSFGETRIAILHDDRLSDLYLHRDEDPDPTGEIHRARLRRTAPALGGAFLDIGDGREAFLKSRKPPPEGTLLTIEIRAEGGAGKLPIATTSLSRPLPDEESPKGDAPALLFRPDMFEPLRSDHREIITDSADIMATLRARGLGDRARLVHDALFSGHGLEDEIMALAEPRVPLPGGAALWIEDTRALTAIDLDSGPIGEGRTSRNAARTVNDRAIPEIARQLRLRRIGGLVAIDFLRLPDKAARLALTERMTAALASDPMPSDVAGFSRLGLFELSRPRRGRSLAHDLGRNGQPTLAAAARMALRAAAREARHYPGRPRPLAVPPTVAAWIEAEGMTDRFLKASGAPLVLSSNPALPPGQFSL